MLAKRAAAEFLGTGVLVATVVGSGIMGTLLSDNLAVTLLINALATVAVLGVLIWAFGPISGAHFKPAVNTSTNERTGSNIWLGEIVATAGLLLVIGALTRTGRGTLGPVLVPAWIGAAYFFTSSTSFANPAVTVGRSLTDTFSGIAPASVPLFIVFQIVGAAVGALLTEYFYPRRGVAPEPLDLPEPIHKGPHD
jgi:glycerol uptake facilitator-like aquaporin